MAFDDDDVEHKGLRKFWKSGGKDTSGITPNLARRIRLALVHLHSAQSIGDIANPNPKDWRFHKYSGVANKYSIDVSGNYRLTFTVSNDKTGHVCNIKLEDPH